MISPNNPFREIFDQEKRRLESAIELAGNTTLPWPEEFITSLSRFMPDDFDEIMRHHPGRKINDANESVKFFLKLFNESYGELEKAIRHYHESYKELRFFSYRGRHDNDQAIFRLNQCIFNFGTAGDALRNLCIKQAAHYKPPGYDEHIANYFATNKLHHFMQNLRGALHHEHFLKAGPAIIYGLDQPSHETKLHLDCIQLLRLDKIRRKKEAREYVEQSGAVIDVGEVFKRYRIIVDDFYGWLLDEMNKSPEFMDYQRCILGRKRIAVRKEHAFFLDQWIKAEVDPYKHLHKYLSDEEMTEVNKFPHRSKGQVDKIIEYTDEHDACDDEMRRLIYKLFKVHPEEASPAATS